MGVWVPMRQVPRSCLFSGPAVPDGRPFRRIAKSDGKQDARYAGIICGLRRDPGGRWGSVLRRAEWVFTYGRPRVRAIGVDNGNVAARAGSEVLVL